jgi:carbon storage regulator CsrA
MLVLTLKENEKVVVPVIGITITITKIKGNRVQVGFEAPKAIKFLRSKLLPTGNPDLATPIHTIGSSLPPCDSVRRGEVWKNKIDSNVR